MSSKKEKEEGEEREFFNEWDLSKDYSFNVQDTNGHIPITAIPGLG